MKIAITGGSGFIGTRLRRELDATGHTWVNVDIRDEQDPTDILDFSKTTEKFKNCDMVYHLAAEHHDNVFPRSRYYDVNVKGMKNVLAAMDENNIKKIIFTSSFAVYGLDGKTPNEQSLPAPFNDYGMSKWEGEQVLQEWAARKQDVNATIVRPVVVFGEGNRGNVYNLINQIARNKFIMIGNGQNKKSIAYIGNVTEFLRFLMNDNGKMEIYNYADTPDCTTRELVDVICDALKKPRLSFALPYAAGIGAGYVFDGIAQVTGLKLPISVVRVQKFCADTTSSADKARAKGFKAPYTIAEGLSRMIAYDFQNTKKAA